MHADLTGPASRTLDGRYRLDRELGRGGMGVVYRATQLALERPVAVKLLSPALASDAAAVLRFRREALAASRLAHPGIAGVLDAGVSDGAPYLVMELVDGESLEAYVASRGRLGAAEAIGIARQIADALGAAHGAGIVHRDVKPANVLLDRQGRARLVDFGLAMLLRDSAPRATRVGMVLGTPDYMAPELARAEAVDARADVYALGATLYEMLTGAPPFPRADPVAAMVAHLTEPLEPASRRAPGVSAELDAVLGRLLDKSRERRPADGAEVVTLLDGLLPSEPRGLATATIIALADRGTEIAAQPGLELARAPSGERLLIAEHAETALAVAAKLGPDVACGVHRGAIDRIGDVALGEAVRGAIRLARLAVAGQALVSSHVHDAVGLGWTARLERVGTRVAIGEQASEVFSLGGDRAAVALASHRVPGGRAFRCMCGSVGRVGSDAPPYASVRVRCAACSGLSDLAPAKQRTMRLSASREACEVHELLQRPRAASGERAIDEDILASMADERT